MRSSRPLDLVAVATLVLLCASWGLQQVAVKFALPAVPPLTQMGLRSAGATLLVLLWAYATGRGRGFATRDGTLGWGLFAGLLFAFEFILIYAALQWTGASRGAIFIYTAPFFVALGALWVLPNERLGPLQWLGLLASFAGVAVALGVPEPSPNALLGDVMMVGAGALWAATTLVIKATPLRSAPPEKVLVYQLGVSAVVGLAGAGLIGEEVSAGALLAAGPFWSLAYQTVWVAGITYVLWFRLLATYAVNPLQAGTAMTPLFGVLGGALLLAEPLSPALLVGALLVVAGLVLISRPKPEPRAA